MTEKNLKPGWRWVRFGDVVSQVKNKTDPVTSGLERYVAGDHMDTDDLRIRRWGEIGSGYLGPAFHVRFKPGQVLYGSRRTYLRKVAVADFEGITANTTFVMESKNTSVLMQEFLPFLMQTDAFASYSVKNSKGSVNPYINFSDLTLFEFALPTPEEQIRFIETLRASVRVCETQAEAIVQLQSLRKSAIDHLLGAQDGIPRVRLEKVASMQNGRPFPGDEYDDQGIKLLRPGNLGAAGYLRWPDDKTVCLHPSWEKTAVDFVIQPGDVVINLTAQSLEDGLWGEFALLKTRTKVYLISVLGVSVAMRMYCCRNIYFDAFKQPDLGIMHTLTARVAR